MKSSLRMTTIALLLGGVLQVQSLAASGVTIDSIAAELRNPTERYTTTNGAETFAEDIEALVKKTSNQKQIKQGLTSVIQQSTLPSTFFDDAQEQSSAQTKKLLAYFAGIRAGCDGITAERDTLSKELTSLQKAVDELRIASATMQQKLKSSEIHAFSDPVASVEVRATESLPAFLEIGSYNTDKLLAEQIYFLNIRGQLASPAGLETSLGELDNLLKAVRNIASNDKTQENLVRASFLVDAIPHIKGIVPIIGGYLQSILGQIKQIDDAVSAKSTFWSKAQPAALQDLQLKELHVRENLAYAVFDALFGTIVKPSTVSAPAAFNNDPSPSNILVSKTYTMHGKLPQTIASQNVVVTNTGAIARVGSTDFATGIDLGSEFMQTLRAATTDFLKKMQGAKELVKTTFASTALTEHSELPSVATAVVTLPVGNSTVDVLNDGLEIEGEDGNSSSSSTKVIEEEKLDA